MTAIADRDKAEFVRQALFYIAVFAGSTLLSVISRFTEERLGLLWREFVTGRAIRLYMADGTYTQLMPVFRRLDYPVRAKFSVNNDRSSW
jgi:putative ATP-binding cassette transporter